MTLSERETRMLREQRDHDGKLYLYVTTSKGIEVTVDRYELWGDLFEEKV